MAVKSIQGLPADAPPRIYRLLCHMAHCDGSVDPREREVLEAYRETFGIDASQAEALEAESTSDNGVMLGRDPRERSYLVDAIIEVVAADGYLDPQEYLRLERTVAFLGVPEQDLHGKLAEAFRAAGSDLPPPWEHPELDAAHAEMQAEEEARRRVLEAEVKRQGGDPDAWK